MVNISLKKSENREIWEINYFHIPNHQGFEERIIERGRKGERREKNPKRKAGIRVSGRIPELQNGWVGRDFRVRDRDASTVPGAPPRPSQDFVFMGLFSHSQPF